MNIKEFSRWKNLLSRHAELCYVMIMVFISECSQHANHCAKDSVHCASVFVKVFGHSVVSDSLRPHGL